MLLASCCSLLAATAATAATAAAAATAATAAAVAAAAAAAAFDRASSFLQVEVKGELNATTLGICLMMTSEVCEALGRSKF